jgi:hypothetical protein
MNDEWVDSAIYRQPEKDPGYETVDDGIEKLLKEVEAIDPKGDSHGSLSNKIRNSYSELGVIEMAACYKKGFSDGIKFIFEAMSLSKDEV